MKKATTETCLDILIPSLIILANLSIRSPMDLTSCRVLVITHSKSIFSKITYRLFQVVTKDRSELTSFSNSYFLGFENKEVTVSTLL